MQTKTYHLSSAEETEQLGLSIAQAFSSGTIYLIGDLGAGKTTFTRGFLKHYSYTGRVKSPTYSLVEPYELADKHIYHFDLYRINEPEEFLHAGFEDYFVDGNICLIEWPEKAKDFIPKADIMVTFEFAAEGRVVKISGGLAQ